MSTLQIINLQIKNFFDNFNHYLTILVIPTIITVVSIVYVVPYIDYSFTYLLLSLLMIFLLIIFNYKAIVSIHRFVILEEVPDLLNFKIKVTFSYAMYSILLALVAFMPLLISVILPFFENVTLSIVSIPLIIGSFIWMLIALPFLSLNMPLVAIGEKISFFEMWSKSKGFRLTLFLQLLLVSIANWVFEFIATYIFQNNYLELAVIVFQWFTFAIYISCISQTYLLWKNNNT